MRSLSRNIRPPGAHRFDGRGSRFGVTVSRDGPSNVYVPTTAEEWAALGIATPTGCWGCQDASGSLAAAVGSVVLAANASPTYQQTVTGWTRKFVGFTDSTANQRFGTSDASLDLAAGESYAALIYAAIDSGGTRRVVGLGGDLGIAVRITAAGLLSTVHNSVIATGAVNHESASATTVRAIIVRRNATTNVSGIVSNLETIAGTHDESAFAGGLKGFGSHTASGAATMKTGLFAIWKGATAETIGSATLTALGW